MSLNKLISNLAIAEQTAQGTPATAPTYIVPLVGSGAVAGVSPTVTIDEETGQTYAINAYVEEVATGFDAPTRAYPPVLGLLLKGLLGTVKTTAAGDTGGLYKHVFTVSPTDMATPWCTIWGNMESDEVKTTDAKVGAIKISFEGNKPLEIATTYAALGASFGADAARPRGGTEMTGMKYLTPNGCEVSLDVAGASLEARKITKFELEMSRNVNPEYFSGSPLPGDLSMGKFEGKTTITVKPSNLDDFRKSITGKADGTTVLGDVVEGAFKVKVKQGDASLEIEASRVPFAVNWPESDAGGGAVELELAADNLLGTYEAGPITITLTNDVVSY